MNIPVEITCSYDGQLGVLFSKQIEMFHEFIQDIIAIGLWPGEVHADENPIVHKADRTFGLLPVPETLEPK